MPLWHAEVGFPAWYKARTDKLALRYGPHAYHALHDDRYSAELPPGFGFPTHLDFSKAYVFEIETIGQAINKYVARVPVTATLDIVLVVAWDGFVKTLWFNRKSDVHKTLDRKKYVGG